MRTNYEDPGRAGSVPSESFTTRERKTGSFPEETITRLFAVGQILPALTVVGYNADKELVPATYAEDGSGVTPAGVTTTAMDTTGEADPVSGPVTKTGTYNPNALVWHDSFDTVEKRDLAFEGSDAPSVFMRRNRHDQLEGDANVRLMASEEFQE